MYVSSNLSIYTSFKKSNQSNSSYLFNLLLPHSICRSLKLSYKGGKSEWFNHTVAQFTIDITVLENGSLL